jgi:hypothetical protein
VPVTAPELELKATYGLAAPEEYQLPPPDAQWTADVYRAFDITKMPSKDAAVSRAKLSCYFVLAVIRNSCPERSRCSGTT